MQACALVREVRIQVALLAIEGDGRARESEPFGVLRLGLLWHEDGVFLHAVLVHAALDDVHVQVDEATHFDATTEGDLAIALGEVQVTDGEVRAVDEDWVEHAGALGQVLDVLVAAIFAWGSGACSFAGDTGELGAGQATEDRGVWLWWQRQRWNALWIGGDQRSLTLVPLVEQLVAWRGAHQAGVNQAIELNARDVT